MAAKKTLKIDEVRFSENGCDCVVKNVTIDELQELRSQIAGVESVTPKEKPKPKKKESTPGPEPVEEPTEGPEPEKSDMSAPYKKAYDLLTGAKTEEAVAELRVKINKSKTLTEMEKKNLLLEADKKDLEMVF